MWTSIISFDDTPKVLLSPQEYVTPVTEIIKMIRKTIPKGKREKESTVNIQCIIIMQIIQHKKLKNSLSLSLTSKF